MDGCCIDDGERVLILIPIKIMPLYQLKRQTPSGVGQPSHWHVLIWN